MRLGVAALLCWVAWVALPAAAQEASVAGRLTLAVVGVRLADLGQTVVYLAADGAPAAPPTKRATIRQRNAYFAPDFLTDRRRRFFSWADGGFFSTGRNSQICSLTCNNCPHSTCSQNTLKWSCNSATPPCS